MKFVPTSPSYEFYVPYTSPIKLIINFITMSKKKLIAGDEKLKAKSSAKDEKKVPKGDEVLKKLLDEQRRFGHDKPVIEYLKSK